MSLTMKKIRKHDIVCLITIRSRLSPIVVTNGGDDSISGIYISDKDIKLSYEPIDRFITYKSLIEYCISDTRNCSDKKHQLLIEDYIKYNSLDMLFDNLHYSVWRLSQDQIESIIEQIIGVDYSEMIRKLYNSSCRWHGDPDDQILKYNSIESTESEKETKTMTKLYKVIKSDKGTLLKTPKDFGEYMASDGEYIMLKMTGQSATSNKPVIQAFKPDQIEEVKPWTFASHKSPNRTLYHMQAPKDSVNVGDVLIRRGDSEIFTVTKTNTKSDTNNIFKGSKVMTEPLVSVDDENAD